MTTRFILPFADVGSGILPSSGAQLFFFKTGTNDDKDTFVDSTGLVANANPVIADSKGLFPDIFIVGSYKVVLKDKNGSQKWEADPVGEGSFNIKEEKPLGDGQVDVTFTKVGVDNGTFFIQGQNVDRGLLTKGDAPEGDYTVTGSLTIKLNRSYPDGSFISAFGSIPVDSGVVVSVHGRTGVVSSVSGDYTASQLTNVPSGTILSTEVQAAINELNTNNSKVLAQTVSGALTAGGRINQIRDSGAFTLPLANSVDVDVIIVVELPDRFKAQTPTITRSGADDIVDGDGTDTSITFTGAAKLTLTSDGISEWSL